MVFVRCPPTIRYYTFLYDLQRYTRAATRVGTLTGAASCNVASSLEITKHLSTGPWQLLYGSATELTRPRALLYSATAVYDNLKGLTCHICGYIGGAGATPHTRADRCGATWIIPIFGGDLHLNTATLLNVLKQVTGPHGTAALMQARPRATVYMITGNTPASGAPLMRLDFWLSPRWLDGDGERPRAPITLHITHHGGERDEGRRIRWCA